MVSSTSWSTAEYQPLVCYDKYHDFGAKTLLSLKYRARTMMGRCQGGFCVPRIVRILRDEYGYNPADIVLRSNDSKLFSGVVREVQR